MVKKVGELLQILGVKKVALKVYFFVRKVYYKSKYSIRKKIIPQKIKRRKRNGVFAIDICNEYGIGAKISWCIEILKYCEENSLNPAIRFSYPKREHDYFSYFFSIKNSKNYDGKITFTKIRFLHELGLSKSYGDILTIDEGARILKKYFEVNQSIKRETDAFYCKHLLGKKILGVHYRGTDKIGEAPELSYEKVKRNIEFAVNHYIKAEVIFLSTDDQNFLVYLSSTLNEIPVICREDYKRSSNKDAVHLDNRLDKIEINKDAVINLMLLSRCDFLLKSSSFLSDISILLNPSLPTVVLNKPYDWALWFPAREILKAMAFSPIN